MREAATASCRLRWMDYVLLEAVRAIPSPLPTVPRRKVLLGYLGEHAGARRNEQDAGICHWLGRVFAAGHENRRPGPPPPAPRAWRKKHGL